MESEEATGEEFGSGENWGREMGERAKGKNLGRVVYGTNERI